MEILAYDQDYFDIPLQDLPPKRHIIICHDPQRRLGKITYAVIKSVSDNGDILPIALGLFWDQEQAMVFANALIIQENK